MERKGKPEIAWIGVVDESDADPELRELFERARDPETGRVDHILAVHSLHPAGLAAHLRLYQASMRPTPGLRKVDRELIALHVSRLNHCHY